LREYVIELGDKEIMLFKEYARIMELEDLPLGELVKQAAFEQMDDDIEGWRVWEEFKAQQAAKGIIYED
jgi:hypothetical protein